MTDSSNELIRLQGASDMSYQDLDESFDRMAEKALAVRDERDSLQARVETLTQERDAAREQIQTLEKELQRYRARTYPMQCELCELQIESADDCEWHGLGNCVDICDSCDGNGFIDKTACKFASQHHIGPCPHCGANIIHPKERWNYVSLSTDERMDALARHLQQQVQDTLRINSALRDSLESAKKHRGVWLHDEDCFSIKGDKPCVCGREVLMAEINAALTQTSEPPSPIPDAQEVKP